MYRELQKMKNDQSSNKKPTFKANHNNDIYDADFKIIE